MNLGNGAITYNSGTFDEQTKGMPITFSHHLMNCFTTQIFMQKKMIGIKFSNRLVVERLNDHFIDNCAGWLLTQKPD